MSKLTDSVIDKIKKDEIKPHPRWHFIAWRVSFWVFFIASVILGGLATGVAIHQLVGTHWEFVNRVGGGGSLRGVLIVLPYLWFIILGITTVIAYKALTKTKTGYRYHPLLLVGISILLSFILGFIFYTVRVSQRFENAVENHISAYSLLQEYQENLWDNAENGIMMGEIKEVLSNTTFTFTNLKGDTWTIHIDKAKIAKNSPIEAGKHAVMIGEAEGNDFYAEKLKTYEEGKLKSLLKR